MSDELDPVSKLMLTREFNRFNHTSFKSNYLFCHHCNNWLSAEIYSTEDGKDNTCGTCAAAADIQLQRNRTLENQLNDFSFPCNISENCKWIGSRTNSDSHKHVCFFRKTGYVCFICAEVGFQGREELFKHILNECLYSCTNKAGIEIEEHVATFNVAEMALPAETRQRHLFVYTWVQDTFLVFVDRSDEAITVRVVKFLQDPIDAVNDFNTNASFTIIYKNDKHEMKVKGKMTSFEFISFAIDDIDDDTAQFYLQSSDRGSEIELKVYFYGYEAIDMANTLAECPVCHERFTTAVYQCPNGHSYCPQCTKALTKCALCRVAINSTRVNLKHVFDNVPVRCAHAPNGCAHIANTGDMDEHTKVCNYEMVNCVLCDGKFLKHRMAMHMRHAHIDLIHQNFRAIHTSFGGYLQQDMVKSMQKYIIYRNEIFCFTPSRLGTQDILQFNVRLLYCNDVADAREYRYIVHIDVIRGECDVIRVGSFCQPMDDHTPNAFCLWKHFKNSEYTPHTYVCHIFYAKDSCYRDNVFLYETLLLLSEYQ